VFVLVELLVIILADLPRLYKNFNSCNLFLFAALLSLAGDILAGWHLVYSDEVLLVFEIIPSYVRS
jgi:Ni/Fe-hydrogenase subunit HybB-like protein